MNVIEWLKVLLLGIVEGITEWLPISSTGHMILVNEFIHLNVSDAFMENVSGRHSAGRNSGSRSSLFRQAVALYHAFQGLDQERYLVPVV